MKSLFALLAFCAIVFISCEKDSFTESPVPLEQIDQNLALISVSVTYQEGREGQNCDDGSCSTSSVKSAEISVFKSSTDASDDSNALLRTKTNASGKVLIEDLDPGTYHITVDCQYGKQQKQIASRKGKLTSIYFVY